MKLYYYQSTDKLLKLRKLLLLLLLMLFTFNMSWGQNQRISVVSKNKTLLSVFENIEKQTGLSIAYNQTKLDITRIVNQDFNDKLLSTVITELLKNSGFTYQFEEKHIIIVPESTQQTDQQSSQKINGIIIDAQGIPMIGANVVVKGTANGTITDSDGKFSIDASQGSILQISYIGYLSKEIHVEEKTNYSIQLLEDSQALNEVVVVGYGTTKKVNVIGSIASINSKQLENRSTPQLSNALTGQMAGVTVIQRSGRPGSSGGEIRVRGVGSFGGASNKSDALVLIDGIPGSLNNVNSEDVESISVLKDASTAAIYGSRAANGVILVTTKTGKEGKIGVSYNGYVGFNTATELPEFVDTWEYATLYNRAVGREVYTQDEIQKYKDGSDPDHFANARYLDEVFSRNGFQTGHDLTVTGGNSQNRYMVSFGYLKQNGLVEKNDYERYNARVNLTNEILPNLTLTSRLSGMYGYRKEPYTAGGDEAGDMLGLIGKALRFPGLTPTRLSDGSFGPGRELHGTPAGWIQSGSFYQNPVFSVNANVHLDYEPIKDLKLSAIGAYSYENNEQKTYRATMKLTGDRTTGPSDLTHRMGKTIYKTFQATAEYNKVIYQHNFSILAGYSWEQEDNRWVEAYRDKFPGNDLSYLNAGSPDNQKASGSGYGWAIQSVFGRAKYNFKERYLLESTVRYDGSSRFPKNRKYGFFPSVAAGWRISEEDFFKSSDPLQFISNLKLKASWGRLGNQNIGNYPYQAVYELGQNYPFGDSFMQGAAVTTATDPTIKWEETETVDGGLETILWDGLLSVNASYFTRRTYDILYKPGGSVSTVLGQNISELNTGELKNYGWEFELGHRNRIGQVGYQVNANLSVIKNKLETLGVGNVEQLNGLVGNGSDLFIGYPIQMYYGYLSDGVFLNEEDIKNYPYDQSAVNPKPQPGDIRYKDINGPDGKPDGKIDPNYDRVYLGTRIPQFTFGLNLNVDYKGFDLSVLLQGIAGVKGQLDGYAGYAFSKDGNIQRWQADGAFDPQNPVRHPTYPRLEDLSNTTTANIVSSDFWIRDASYLRLKNIRLGYSFPKKMMQAAGLGKYPLVYPGRKPTFMEQISDRMGSGNQYGW